MNKYEEWHTGLRNRQVSKQKNGTLYDRLQLIKSYHWCLFLISIPQPCGKPGYNFVTLASSIY